MLRSRHFRFLSRQRRRSRRDGEIVAAAQEERFTRKKHDPRFPRHAIEYCLAPGSPRRIDHVVFYEKPFLKFERLLETYLAFAPRGLRSFAWRCRSGSGKSSSRRTASPRTDGARPGSTGDKAECSSPNTIMSHAACAFFPSPFEEAAVLTMDGVGEWATTSAAHRRRATTRDPARKSISRIRSDCSIPPSPTTPASKSIPANTR